MPDEIIRQTFGLKDKPTWKLEEVREEIIKDEEWEKAITKILYRPFDVQWIFYHAEVIERSRKEVMCHMMEKNLGLVFHKREELLIPYSHFLVTAEIVEHGCLSSKTTCYLAPLYLYPNAEKKDLFSSQKTGDRKPNLNPKILKSLTEVYGKELTPEEIFHYIYGALYSNTYRTKYAEFLKIDFPRVPFTKDYDLFIKMGKYGKRLVDLHLLEASELSKPIAKFQGSGDYRMDKQKYSEDENRVYINKTQYFEGIEKEVWKYQIGGYQVLDKWLKDRKGGTLSLDDIKHYCKIATALKRTIEIQEDIDRLYPDIEEEVIKFRKE